MSKQSFIIACAFALAMTASAETSPSVGVSATTSTGQNFIQQIKDIRSTANDDFKNLKQNTKTEIKNLRATVKGEVTNIRQTVKEDIQSLRNQIQQNPSKRAELKALIEQKRVETRTVVQQKRDDFMKAVQAKKEGLKDLITKKREALKIKLKSIKDERKREAVQKIDENLDAINANRLQHFSDVLDQLDKVLLNIISRTDKADANGKNVAAVRIAIMNAQNMIAAARAAITAQAGKTYLINITTENALRLDVQKTRAALYDDLKKVFDQTKKAREAVRTAATTLAGIPGVNVDISTTSTTSSVNP